ncbi:hypothetical protein B296_00043861 [Ensete ventricosum]|uniref:Uncharacterized protein n=1 Tax=Ensete ventricosum TaxID=4639 RepID=A0A426XKL0_ENSVE|nr:hypothetical protein B296_00043861 [Ensete ventricosum]
MSATSASHSTDSSCAFFSSPQRRFAKLTCLFILFSILFSSTFPLPMPMYLRPYRSRNHHQPRENHASAERIRRSSTPSFLLLSPPVSPGCEIESQVRSVSEGEERQATTRPTAHVSMQQWTDSMASMGKPCRLRHRICLY